MRRDRKLEAVARAALRTMGRPRASGSRPTTPRRRTKTPADQLVAKLRESVRRDELAQTCRTYGIPTPTFEHRFHEPRPGETRRKWRLDLAWPDARIAGEIEGGVWSGGRHTRGKGFTADIEKYNALAAAGWLLARGTPSDVASGDFFVAIGLLFMQRRES